MGRVNRHENWKHTTWPEPWCAAWKVAITKGDAFREGGPATKLAARSVWNDEMAFGRYQQFLSQYGLTDIGPAPSLDNLRAFANHLGATLAPYSVMAHLSQVIAAVRLMVPEADLHDANAAIQRFATTVKAVRSSKDRVRSPIDLIAIGKTMMVEADDGTLKERPAAREFRTGALIMGAALCPLRHRNWRMMRIGEQVDLESGRVFFKASEMKRKKDMEFQLPPELLLVFRRYVETYRPHLLNFGVHDQGYLWPGPTGGMTHRNALGIAVCTAMLKRTKIKFNFHLFRHSAATFVSEITPGRTRMVSGVLHHARLSTANKYYIKGQKRHSFRQYQSAVRDIVAKGRRRKTQAAFKKKNG
jgi:hypothetical protein